MPWWSANIVQGGNKGRLDSAQKWPKETTAEFNHAIVMSPKARSKLLPQLVVKAVRAKTFQWNQVWKYIFEIWKYKTKESYAIIQYCSDMLELVSK